MAVGQAMTASNVDNAIPEKWDRKVRLDATAGSFFYKYAGGEGSRAALIEKDELAEDGDQINVTVLGRVLGDGTSGEDELLGSESKVTVGTFPVTVEAYQNAVQWTKKAMKLSIISCISTTGKLMADWVARYVDYLVLNAIMPVGSTTVPNTHLYAGGVTTLATLDDASYLGPEEIRFAKAALIHKGAKPIKVLTKSGQVYNYYGCLMSEVDYYHLTGDSNFLSAVKDALPRSEGHPVLTGAWGAYDGVLLYTLPTVEGVQGSLIRPECSVYSNYTAAGTTLTVGADDGVNYTRHFPSSGNLGIGHNSADPEMTAYSAKTNYSFTITALDSNHDAGELVTYGSGGTEDTHAHAVSNVLFFGAEAAAIAWGQRPKRITEDVSYGQKIGIGVDMIVGVGAVKDSAGDYPNALVLHCCSPVPYK